MCGDLLSDLSPQQLEDWNQEVQAVPCCHDLELLARGHQHYGTGRTCWPCCHLSLMNARSAAVRELFEEIDEPVHTHACSHNYHIQLV